MTGLGAAQPPPNSAKLGGFCHPKPRHSPWVKGQGHPKLGHCAPKPHKFTPNRGEGESSPPFPLGGPPSSLCPPPRHCQPPPPPPHARFWGEVDRNRLFSPRFGCLEPRQVPWGRGLGPAAPQLPLLPWALGRKPRKKN